MDGEAFLRVVEEKITPFAPVLIKGIIKKQLSAVGATPATLTPEKAEKFIGGVAEALQMFLGPQGSLKVKHMMLKELRRFAPEYFERKSLI